MSLRLRVSRLLLIFSDPLIEVGKLH